MRGRRKGVPASRPAAKSWRTMQSAGRKPGPVLRPGSSSTDVKPEVNQPDMASLEQQLTAFFGSRDKTTSNSDTVILYLGRTKAETCNDPWEHRDHKRALLREKLKESDVRVHEQLTRVHAHIAVWIWNSPKQSLHKTQRTLRRL